MTQGVPKMHLIVCVTKAFKTVSWILYWRGRKVRDQDLVAMNVNLIATGTRPHGLHLSEVEGGVGGGVEDSLDTMTTADPTGIEIETVRNVMMMTMAPEEVVAVALLTTIDSMPVGTEDTATHPKILMGYLASRSTLSLLRLLSRSKTALTKRAKFSSYWPHSNNPKQRRERRRHRYRPSHLHQYPKSRRCHRIPSTRLPRLCNSLRLSSLVLPLRPMLASNHCLKQVTLKVVHQVLKAIILSPISHPTFSHYYKTYRLNSNLRVPNNRRRVRRHCLHHTALAHQHCHKDRCVLLCHHI
jgi:hypothetical protein